MQAARTNAPIAIDFHTFGADILSTPPFNVAVLDVGADPAAVTFPVVAAVTVTPVPTVTGPLVEGAIVVVLYTEVEFKYQVVLLVVDAALVDVVEEEVEAVAEEAAAAPSVKKWLRVEVLET